MTTKTKIINGHAFEISQPYVEGQTINEAEARALNQVRSENIGNNVREKVKELMEAGDIDGAIALVTERDAEYVITLANVGTGRKLDPVENEARKLARELIKNSLLETGRKITIAPEGVTKEEWDAKIEAETDRIAGLEEVLKLAKKNVAERQKRGSALMEAAGAISV